jgi:hypothetical protein
MEMLLHRRMLVLVAGVALALAVVLVLLPRASSAAPPEPVDVEDVTLPGCDFPVEADVSGKSKVTDLPSGQTLITSPNLRITLTNLDETTNQVTYVITGSFLTTEQDDGNLFVEARGRNLIFGPEVGIFLTIGQFTFIGFKADEGVVVAITPPTGEGSLTDVCALLA